MLNYEEIVIQANEHRALLLVNTEHKRLAQVVAPAHPYIRAWIGRRLIEWG